MDLASYNKSGPAYSKVILYGAPFTGKTTAAAMLAKDRRIQIIDVDRNAGALIHSIPEEYHSNIDIVPMPDSLDNPVFGLLLEFLTGQRMDYNPLDGKKLSVKYRGVVANVQPKLPEIKPPETSDIIILDSGTSITESLINYVRANRNRSANEEKLDELQLSERDWGLVSGYMAKLTKVLASIPYHVILICHELIVTMPDGTTKIAPMLGSRNTSRNMAKDFSAVVHMSIEGTQFKSTSSQRSNSKIVVGSRSNIFMENGRKLIDYFNGSVEKIQATNPSVKDAEKNPLGQPDKVFSSAKK